MIVEHQPQNVITTLSVRLAAQCAQHVECCKGWGNWRVLCLHCGRVHTFFLLPRCFQRCSAIVFSLYRSSAAIQVSNLLCPCRNRLPFLWGFCSLFWVYSAVGVSMVRVFIYQTHLVSIKRIYWTHTHTTWNYCKLQTICRLNQMQFDLTRDFKQSNRDRAWLFSHLSLFWSGLWTNMAIIIRAVWACVVKRAPNLYNHLLRAWTLFFH